jgi:hypothetical protein
MSSYQDSTAIPVRSARTGSRSMTRAKVIVVEAAHTLSATTSDTLLAYAITRNAVAALAIITGPHIEVLPRCIFHGHG